MKKQRLWVPLVAVMLAGLVLVPTTFATGEPGTTIYAQLGTNRFPGGQGAANASLNFISERDIVLGIEILGPAGTNNSVRVYVDGTCANPGEWVINRTANAGQDGPFLEVLSNSGVNTIQVNQLDVDRIRDELAGNPSETFALMVARLINGVNFRTCTAFGATQPPPLTTSTATTSATTTAATTTAATTTAATTTVATTSIATTPFPPQTGGPLTYVASSGTEPDGPFMTKLISDSGGPVGTHLTFILPQNEIRFQDIEELSTTLVKEDADDTCGGGSPRFVIDVDTTGDGVFDGYIVAYVGNPQPSCPADTGNLAEVGGPGDDAGRYDLSNLNGGPVASTYSDVLTLMNANPTWTVPDIQLQHDNWNAQPDGRSAFSVQPTIIVSP